MKKLISLFLIIAFFYITVIAVNAQGKEKDYTEAFKLVEVWLEAQKDFESLPGITAIVVNGQEVVWKGAFGDANPETGLEASPSTLFSICSISKLFTSVAVMKLYDEGKLRLDDLVCDVLPWYNLGQKFPGSGPITIRTLLTHSSGLPRESAHPYWTSPDFPFPTSEEIKSGLETQETLYPASTYFQYSNLGLSLLGEVVSEISGITYEDYINQNILIPLGMENTCPCMPEELHGKQLAIGYSSPTRDGSRKKVNFFKANGITPAAGFSSNVEDLAKFASWQLRLLDTTTTEILKPSTLKYMHQVHFTDPSWETTWGLGFSVRKDPDGKTVVRHGGSCPGYRTELSVYPKDKMAFSVMINASGTNPGKYVSGIKSIMAKVKAPDEGKNIDLSEYTGYYSSQPWWSEKYVGVLNGILITMGLPSDSPGKSITFYKHIEGDTFQRLRKNKELGETLVFERGENGKVFRCKQHGNYSVRINRR